MYRTVEGKKCAQATKVKGEGLQPRIPFPRWRPQLGAKPMNITTRAKLSVEREPVIGQTLIDMRGRKPAWEGIGRCGFQGDVWKDELAVMIPAAVG